MEKDYVWRKIFFRYLKEKGIYRKYIENVYKYRKQKGENYLGSRFYDEALSEEAHCSNALIYAFSWNASKEGKKFWAHINCDWNDYIEKKLNEKHSNSNCYLQKLLTWMRKKTTSLDD